MNSKINQNDYQVLLREEKELEENVPIRVSIFQKGSTDRIFQKGTEFFKRDRIFHGPIVRRIFPKIRIFLNFRNFRIFPKFPNFRNFRIFPKFPNFSKISEFFRKSEFFRMSDEFFRKSKFFEFPKFPKFPNFPN